MELVWVTQSYCKECGCLSVVAEFDRGGHCNGERFQSREFECGYTVGWSPNFSRLEERSCCTRSTGYLENKKERSKLLTRLEKVVDSSALTDKEKDRINGQFPNLLLVY